MAPALLYLATWSFIIILNISRKGANAVDSGLELTFSQEPQSVVVLKGSSAWLNCSVYWPLPPAAGAGDADPATPAVNLTWLKDGQPLAPSKRFQLSPDSGRLHLRKIARRHEGSYQCLAANELGRIVSRPAHVEAAYLGRLKQEPRPVSSQVGDNARFQCVIEGKPEPSVQWQRGGQPLPQNSRYAVLSASGVLQLSGVTASDAGRYSCVATNLAGARNSSEAELSVKTQGIDASGPVVILSQPVNVTKVSGTSVMFECFATGRPQPTISWLKDGRALSLSGSSGYSVENQGNLVLASVRYQDTGRYTCLAGTGEGGQAEQHHTLTVLVAPLIDITSGDVLGRPQTSTVRFSCLFIGLPPPRVSWLLNGQEIRQEGRFKFIEDGTVVVISQSQQSDSGYVQCWGSNEAGSATAVMRLGVFQKVNSPDPPHSLTAATYSYDSIVLRWKPPRERHGDGPIAYSVHYAPTAGGTELQKVEKTTQLKIEHLQAATNYSFYVMAYNHDGASAHSETVHQMTAPNVLGQGSTPAPVGPQDAAVPTPTDVHVAILNATAIRVTWSVSGPGIVISDSGETSVRYTIRYVQLQSSGQDKTALGIEAHQGKVTVRASPAVVGGLTPYSTYLVDIRAETDIIGPYTHNVEVSMPETFPSPPKDLVVEWLEPETMHIVWHEPDHSNGLLRYYVVYYSTDDQQPTQLWNTIIRNASVHEAAILGLEKGQVYYFKVAAATYVGEGKCTSVIIQTTTSGAAFPSTQHWFSDKGIIIGVAIGGVCIIICVIIIVLRNRCCGSPPPPQPQVNGCVPAAGSGYPPHNLLVHRVDGGSFTEMDSFTPMLSPSVPYNDQCDTKGGYDTYPRFERSRLLKGLNGFTGGRTRTVSSGYTSDRDLDHIDEGIQVHPVSEGEHPVEMTRLDGHPPPGLQHPNHIPYRYRGPPPPPHPHPPGGGHRGSWPSGSSGSQDSNKDSGTGTECLAGPPSTGEDCPGGGDSSTLTRTASSSECGCCLGCSCHQCNANNSGEYSRCCGGHMPHHCHHSNGSPRGNGDPSSPGNHNANNNTSPSTSPAACSRHAPPDSPPEGRGEGGGDRPGQPHTQEGPQAHYHQGRGGEASQHKTTPSVHRVNSIQQGSSGAQNHSASHDHQPQATTAASHHNTTSPQQASDHHKDKQPRLLCNGGVSGNRGVSDGTTLTQGNSLPQVHNPSAQETKHSYRNNITTSDIKHADPETTSLLLANQKCAGIAHDDARRSLLVESKDFSLAGVS